MPASVVWTCNLLSQWFYGLADSFPSQFGVDTLNNFANTAGFVQQGNMKYSQIATWACIPLLTCHGVDAANPADNVPNLETMEQDTPFFSKEWQVLGPFEIGTRESSWGTDPLETYGGFQKLKYDPNASFLSSLGPDGAVKWSPASSSLNSTASPPETTLHINLPPENRTSLQSVYGWDALQYQAWARGKLTVPGNGTEPVAVALHTVRTWEIRVDDQLYFGGDFFAFRRAPLLLSLKPGPHQIDLRVVRDVRALGGVGEPSIDIILVAEKIPSQLIVDAKSILVADVVENRLISPYASITLQNAMGSLVQVTDIKADDPTSGLELKLLKGVRLDGHQSRAVGFTITRGSEASTFPTELSFHFEYTVKGSATVRQTPKVTIKFTSRQMSEVQQNTFIQPGGVVSYATMRPPSPQKCTDKTAKLPVLLGLHGAGQAASDEIIRTMLDGVKDICAWTLFPSGVTPWSGDDWHTWGFADLQNSVHALNDWIKAVSWTGPEIVIEDWIVAGHSNGGQGTWYTISHYPDNVIAAAPVAGYTSIENYVPYSMWHNTDALLAAQFFRARQDFKHELLLDNFVGIPVHQQHGASDDNVVVYHSRLMHRLMKENGWPSEYLEVPGKNHWYDGIMTSDYLKEFYYKYAKRPDSDHLLPVNFAITIPPAGPDRAGSINVQRDLSTHVWKITTRNIRRFHLELSAVRALPPSQIQIDGSEPFPVTTEIKSATTWYTQDNSGKWMASQEASWRTTSERYGRQTGVNAILRTPGPFTVSSSSSDTDVLALQTCRNLFQYLSADCDLFTSSDGSASTTATGNVITLSLGHNIGPSTLATFPISLNGNGLVVQSAQGPTTYPFEAGLGAIFIRPLENERLELVIWGYDMAGLQQAARLVPVLTGVGQPDFVVVNKGTPLKGQGSLYAAGFFDSTWKISAASYVS
ncbi:uncharacterized protein GIQ15_06540 [Arthroderma uncinatum]|uniref:uncharacterized protein n=1 Tax=Arthroderma uncinatum TaxID=74035 RepID=UPI00144A4F3E|nr:uncharacterized protein GIQ15_06540 [Arthroderma uncinatum]KAF3479564.1 hypothetical protein GIQ15_06540 [Arthroderma uncinatum]